MLGWFSKPLNFVPRPVHIMPKRKFEHGYPVKRQKASATAKTAKEGSTEEILLADIECLLSQKASERPADLGQLIANEIGTSKSDFSPPERYSEIDVKISELSSTGDGLGLASTSDHVYVVPFSLPGELVRAKVVHYFPRDRYTLTDFISVLQPAPNRNNSLVKCPYFAKCSGCQFQMLPYEEQLAHKKTIVEKAYRNFSSLPSELIPAIGDTIGSPLQYGYRTKLTPHFDSPLGSTSRRARQSNKHQEWTEVPPIGFMQKGTRKTIDIEECPIGTPALQLGLKRERQRVKDQLATFRKGATLLLRESTKRIPLHKDGHDVPAPSKAEQNPTDVATNHLEASRNDKPDTGLEPLPDHNVTNANATDPLPYTEEKSCVTDSNALSTEYVDDYIFSNPAGFFFQNNNSILPPFTSYIRAHILGPSNPRTPITNLIDAYCGSGLFTITLSSLFTHSIGIDIASASIRCARANATANAIPNATFLPADASQLFASVRFPPDETVVVIDPPRKGCDEGFLRQLLRYRPKRVCYVSCNVHTQARDVGVLVQGREEVRYRIESLRGFDFFPQTGHVEGVAFLERVD